MGDTTSEVVLLGQDMTVTYRGPKGKHRVTALEGATVTVHQGDSIAVLGRNGAGKSTLLKALAGLVPLSGGRVQAQSRPVLLSVNSALLVDLTGRENAYLGSLALGMSSKEAREATDEIVHFAGLGAVQHRALRTYSTGMAARLKFAICTARPRDILIMDEALSVGDQDFQQACQERLARVTRESGAVLLTSHSVSLLSKTCSRALLVENAKVAYDGSITEGIALYSDSTSRARLGNQNE